MIVAGSLPLIFARPWVGILVWSWLGYMNPHRLAWGFAYDFPFSLLVGLTTLAALVFYRGPKKIITIPLNIYWYTWIFWMNISTLLALDRAKSSVEWDRTMKIQLFAILTMVLIRTRRQVDALVWMIVLSLGFFGVKGGLFSILTGGNYLVWGPPGSFIEGNNALGLAMVMTLPLIGYLLQVTLDKRLKLVLLGIMLLTCLSILTTHSRGAFLALGAMGVVLWFYSSRKIVIGALLVCAAIVMWNFMPEHWHERIFSIGSYQEDGSAMGRINAWWFAFNLAKDYPLTGGGFGTFTAQLFLSYAPVPDDFHDAHSIYFEVLAEHGFVGLALFLIVGATSIFSNMRNISLAKRREDLAWVASLSRMLIVALCSYAVGGAFLGLAYFDLYYHLIALTVILRMVARAPPENEDYTTISEKMKKLKVKHGFDKPLGQPPAAAKMSNTGR